MKQIETTFGVDASAPAGGMMMAMGPGAAAAAEPEEAQTEFNLIILDCAADKRIAAIKVVRGLTTLGLKEAKDAVTALPFTILEAKPKADVEKAKKDLEDAGCKCEVRPPAARCSPRVSAHASPTTDQVERIALALY